MSRVCDCDRPNVAIDADGVRYCFDCGRGLKPAASRALEELADLVADGLAERLAALVAASASEPWITLADAAEHLACKTQRIYDLVHRQRQSGIPVRREGGRLLFRRSELDEWLARRNAA
jgi:excisionase family DNA binding protein